MATGSSLRGFGWAGPDEVKRNRGWFLVLGALLIVLGIVAVGLSVLTTLASVLLFGWMLVASGALQVIHAFWREKNWHGFFLDLFAGILSFVVGFMLVTNPLAGATTLTLLIAMFLFIGGIERILASLTGHFPNRPWLLLNGVIDLGLGVLIWRQWPVSGLWVIGLFVGVDMLLTGWSAVMLALTANAHTDQAS
jgi:uncharacterized membrane protein HdeD (DUF308 family)